MIKRHMLAAATALLLAGAGQAHAQATDSALVVTSEGKTLFRVNRNGGAVFYGEHDGGSSADGIPVEGPGTRVLWHA